MNFFPETTSRFGINPGSRFVQQQQFWAVNEAGCQRQTLFPSTRELTGELSLALPQPKFVKTLSHRLSPFLQAIHARDEIEILLDA